MRWCNKCSKWKPTSCPRLQPCQGLDNIDNSFLLFEISKSLGELYILGQEGEAILSKEFRNMSCETAVGKHEPRLFSFCCCHAEQVCFSSNVSGQSSEGQQFHRMEHQLVQCVRHLPPGLCVCSMSLKPVYTVRKNKQNSRNCM
jgi:hypothetical protein